MGRRNRWAKVCSDTRGANLVEYLLIAGVVGVAGLVGLRAFGATASAKTAEQARCVETLECRAGTHSGAPGPTGARAPNGPGAQPAFQTIPNTRDVAYLTFDGDVSILGAGDGNAFHPSDVFQGEISDCYLMAALAELALRDPDRLRHAVRDNGDGTFTVTFYERPPDWRLWDRTWHGIQIVVTGDFPARNGNPVFAQRGDIGGGQAELWAMLIEKAYAQWRGGYDAIGHGGFPGQVLSALTGHDADTDADRSMADLADTWARGDAITVYTPLEDEPEGPLFANDTLLGDHAYFVTDVDSSAQTITVRNPWGWAHPEITLTYDEYRQHFAGTESTATR